MSDTQPLVEDPEEIYLEPACCASPYEGRRWCANDDFDDCDEGIKATRYILVNKARAIIVALLSAINAQPMDASLTQSAEMVRAKEAAKKFVEGLG